MSAVAWSIADWKSRCTATHHHDLRSASSGRAVPHVCCLCGKQHRRGATTYDPARTRCVRDCTIKLVVSKPHPWVGKGACAICGATTPRGTARCKNRDVCLGRALNGLRVIRPDDAWIRAEYEAARARNHDTEER